MLTLSACNGAGGSASPGGAVATVTQTVPGVSPAGNAGPVTVPPIPGDAPVAGAPSAPAAPATTHVAAPAAQITSNASAGKAINPTTPITVQATGGTLTTVRLVNPKENVTVSGKLSADRRSWTSIDVLGYNKTYRLQAAAVNAEGTPSTTTTDFSTLTPKNVTMPYFQTIGGSPLQNSETFGVGMVAIVHFDEPITDKAVAQKALKVTTSPQVNGSWYWADDQNVHFRPEKFWPAGTKVTITANVYGLEVGPGLYGQSDKSVSFTIGRQQVTYAYDNAPNGVDKVVVKNGAGKTLRTMNTSMGKHGGVTVNGKYINFYTMGGTYTVLGHENPAMMSSASYGLPANAPGGYAPEPIYWSTRISTGGIFLHELNNTIWAQNSGQDVSHGCLNLDTSNAKWFYQHSLIGDPVIIQGASGAPAIQLWQGGDWSVSWKDWLAGSALH